MIERKQSGIGDDGTMSRAVAVHRTTSVGYPALAPFHPPSDFPELPVGERDPSNTVYACVRELFRSLGLDATNFETPGWNPLGTLVAPGDLVVLKPNLVKESHLFRPDDWDYVVTHGAIIRAVIDYVLIALDGKGRLVVTDGPQTDSSFEKICERNGLFQLEAYYKGRSSVPVEVMDLRQEEWTERDGVIISRKALAGDPMGYAKVELGTDSEFIGHAGMGRYYGASYDLADTNRAHDGERHDYMVSGTVLAADVVINLPKLKTHKKAGITCSLKNLVGINGHKNWLPHHTEGTPAQGGDQFPDSSAKNTMENLLVGTFKRVLRDAPGPIVKALSNVKKVGRAYFGDTEEVVRSGNWYGNDTIWRMILDLNKAMFYFGHDGARLARPRKYFTLVDGIFAGEGNGPMAPDLVRAGVLVAGFNPVAVDCACAKLMGFDWRKIPQLWHAFEVERLPLVDFRYEEIVSASNCPEFEGRLCDWSSAEMMSFQPHFGWKGHVEIDGRLSLPV